VAVIAVLALAAWLSRQGLGMSLVLAIAFVLMFVLCRRSGTRSEVSRAIVQRAWQAAVIAAFMFPPLAFYSLRLLWKLSERKTPLGGPDRCRVCAAFLLGAGATLFCVAVVGLLLYALVSAFR
jgi:hypothetical protein